jgi:uncharacterized protein
MRLRLKKYKSHLHPFKHKTSPWSLTIGLALIAACTVWQFACKPEPPRPVEPLKSPPPMLTNKKQIRVDTASIWVEIADDEAERTNGLMNRDVLPENEGMLFVFPKPEPRSFWMKNCRFTIDIAYIDAAGHITDIISMPSPAANMAEQDLPTYPSSAPAQYALEANKDWFKKRGIKVGSLVRF